MDPAWFLAQLKFSTDALSQYVRIALPQLTDSKEWKLWISGEVPPVLIAAVARGLNVLIEGPCIWEKVRFSQVSLRKDLDRLLTRKREGYALMRLNRLLLEDAYPRSIAKSLWMREVVLKSNPAAAKEAARELKHERLRSVKLQRD